jgi:hypothetical protein
VFLPTDLRELVEMASQGNYLFPVSIAFTLQC